MNKCTRRNPLFQGGLGAAKNMTTIYCIKVRVLGELVGVLDAVYTIALRDTRLMLKGLRPIGGPLAGKVGHAYV